jgi:hypothetical protein
MSSRKILTFLEIQKEWQQLLKKVKPNDIESGFLQEILLLEMLISLYKNKIYRIPWHFPQPMCQVWRKGLIIYNCKGCPLYYRKKNCIKRKDFPAKSYKTSSMWKYPTLSSLKSFLSFVGRRYQYYHSHLEKYQ